jgi:hypothetical protein
MEQIMEAIKFLLFYGMQAFAIGLVVGIGVIATLYELIRDKTHRRRAAPPQGSPRTGQALLDGGRSWGPTAPCGDSCTRPAF